ncbi:MAG: TonB-dependent receptor [Vicinamibacterales bacterium]
MSLLLLGVAPASAQRTTGEISGIVADDSGLVLPGVTLTLHGAGLPSAGQVSVSADNGGYRFANLSPGTYDLEAVLEGFNTLKREGVTVGVGASVSLALTLKVGSLAETITVTGAAPVVNVSSAQVSTNYTQEWVEAAPVRRFSFFDLINAAPGVSQTTSTSAGTTNATSLGGSVNDNSYQIDGTSLTAPGAGGGWAWPNTDAIQEIEVLQLGAAAEYGNVQGAVFNIVTRQGGNEFHGDGNFYYMNDALTGRNTTPAQDSGLPYYRKKFNDTTWQLSGPAVRDRLWFFGSYQSQRQAVAAPGFKPSDAPDDIADRIFYKVTYNMTPMNRLMFGYHDDYWKLPPTLTPGTATSTLTTSHGDNPTPNLVYTGTLSDRSYIEARVSGYFAKDSNDAIVPQSFGITQVTNDDTGAVTGGVTQLQTNKSWRRAVSFKYSHYAPSLLGGSHDLKVGVQHDGGGGDSVIATNDTMTIFPTSGVAAFGTTRQPYHQGALIRSTGAYFDDTYKRGRITLNLGIRIDRSSGGFQPLPVLDNLSKQTGQLSPEQDPLFTWTPINPRLGFVWKVTDSGTTVVKAHYGRYSRGPLYSDYIAASPGITPSYSFNVAADGTRTNFVATSSNKNLTIDPNVKEPFTDQYIIQAEHQLTEDLGLQVNYVHKSGKNYPAWVDTTGIYVQVPYVDSVGRDATGQTVMVQRLTTPSANSIFMMTSPDGMYTKYDGMAASLTKRLSHNWQGTFSLVYSKSKGRLSSSNGNPGGGQSATSASFGRFPNGPNDFVNSDGLLTADRPVVAKVQFLYRLPWDLQVSTNINHQTGREWARTIRVSGLGFPAAPTILMDPLDGNKRLPDTNLVDVRVQKSIKFTPTVRADLFMDLLNATNQGLYESLVSRLGTSTAYGAPTAFTFPRRAQLGVKIRF